MSANLEKRNGRKRRLFNREHWVGWSPNGIGQTKPNHYLDMAKVAWANRDNLRYAWKVLTRGVCDGCALGTTGLRDHTMEGVHLCMVRLNLLRLNTMGPAPVEAFADADRLATLSSRDLREMGRLPSPMVRHRGDPGFTPVSWDLALSTIAERLRATDPGRVGVYLTSRGITNETYYTVQKAARYLGIANVDNSSRLCHAPSTVGLKQTLGVAATTCSYSDWIGADLIVFFGANVPNNQPVTTKYLYYAKLEGTKVAVVNPYREPGLDRYWVPSVLESGLFGTKIADDWFPVHHGGDVAFVNGVLKALDAVGMVDRAFIGKHTEGWPELSARLAATPWEELERDSGASKAEMQRFARLYGHARHAVIVWSMGITQHAGGVENVKALVNLALARGNVGREHAGLMPIRGHSGVQGGAEMGCVPDTLPGGVAVGSPEAARFEALWGFRPPASPGLTAVEMIEAAHAGRLDILWSVGGNWLETLPDPDHVEEALRRVPLRVHQDVVATSAMLADPADTVVLLPATTRYEQPGGGTETTTERRIYYSPEIPGHRIPGARWEGDVWLELAERLRPGARAALGLSDGPSIRADIAQAVPFYAGIEKLREKGDQVQWGGPRLCDGWSFPTPTGKARFSVVASRRFDVPEGSFLLSTRRGKQFNSMVQGERDSLNDAERDSVLMAREDMERLGIPEGGEVLVRSSVGEMTAYAMAVPMRPGNVQVHWPEANRLVRRGALDPVCKIPDYNAVVELIPLDGPPLARRAATRRGAAARETPVREVAP